MNLNYLPTIHRPLTSIYHQQNSKIFHTFDENIANVSQHVREFPKKYDFILFPSEIFCNLIFETGKVFVEVDYL